MQLGQGFTGCFGVANRLILTLIDSKSFACFSLGTFMALDLYIGGAIALALAVYLAYALVHPEKF